MTYLFVIIALPVINSVLLDGRCYAEFSVANLATVGVLYIIILMFAPISGAHFNPAVTVADALLGSRPWSDVAPYVGTQIAGGAVGVIIAAVAVVGWIVAFSYQGQIGGLQDALAAAETEKSAAVGQLAVEHDLAVTGALELLEDHLVHPGTGVDQGRGEDGQGAALLAVAGRAEELLRRFQECRERIRCPDKAVTGAGFQRLRVFVTLGDASRAVEDAVEVRPGTVLRAVSDLVA